MHAIRPKIPTILLLNPTRREKRNVLYFLTLWKSDIVFSTIYILNVEIDKNSDD